MNKIAVISDIHGNIPALDAVLEDIRGRGINRIFCLGDLAGKGPGSARAVDLIREHCEVTVKGNWDWFMTEKENPVLGWHQTRLGEERLAFLKDMPDYSEFFMSGRLVRLCHASPNDLFHRTFLHSSSDDRMKLFEPTPTMDREADVVGYGDIHGAHVDFPEGRTIFNTGSVGNPLDITQASYGVLEGEYGSRETSPFSVSLVRVPYDIEKAVDEAVSSGMPEIEAYVKELRTGVYRGRK